MEVAYEPICQIIKKTYWSAILVSSLVQSGSRSPQIYSKEGILLRNISAAPICDHFTVEPPGSGIREVGLF